MHGKHQTLDSAPDAPAGNEDRLHFDRCRLLLEAAIEEGYPVRLEQRVAAGRTSMRIVQPVGLEITDADASPGGMLITRTSDQRESKLPLDGVDGVSIVTTRLRSDQERRGRWTVGDTVLDAEFGLGVVQAFRDGEEGGLVVVRFATAGCRALPLTRPHLRPSAE